MSDGAETTSALKASNGQIVGVCLLGLCCRSDICYVLSYHGVETCSICWLKGAEGPRQRTPSVCVHVIGTGARLSDSQAPYPPADAAFESEAEVQSVQIP